MSDLFLLVPLLELFSLWELDNEDFLDQAAWRSRFVANLSAQHETEKFGIETQNSWLLSRSHFPNTIKLIGKFRFNKHGFL